MLSLSNTSRSLYSHRLDLCCPSDWRAASKAGLEAVDRLGLIESESSWKSQFVRRKEGEGLVGIFMGTRHLATPAVSKGADIILQDRGRAWVTCSGTQDLQQKLSMLDAV